MSPGPFAVEVPQARSGGARRIVQRGRQRRWLGTRARAPPRPTPGCRSRASRPRRAGRRGRRTSHREAAARGRATPARRSRTPSSSRRVAIRSSRSASCCGRGGRAGVPRPAALDPPHAAVSILTLRNEPEHAPGVLEHAGVPRLQMELGQREADPGVVVVVAATLPRHRRVAVPSGVRREPGDPPIRLRAVAGEQRHVDGRRERLAVRPHGSAPGLRALEHGQTVGAFTDARAPEQVPRLDGSVECRHARWKSSTTLPDGSSTRI